MNEITGLEFGTKVAVMRPDMSVLLQDLRYGLRTLSKSPGFAAVAVLTLALGIGANTAIFSIVEAVLLRPLPYAHPEQLVRIVDNLPGLGLKDVGMSVPEWRDLQARSGVFDEVSPVWPVDANLTGAMHPERVETLAVGYDYFSLLGVKAQMGRVFGPQDSAQGFADALLISDALWRRSYGADPNILGKKLRLDNDIYTIVGVMPAGFRHPGKTVAGEVEVWITAGYAAPPFPSPPNRAQNMLPGAIARIKAGLSTEAAQARLDSFVAELRRAYPKIYPEKARWSIRIEPLQQSVVGNVRPLILVLFSAVSLILLIGCANIANLLLARASTRQQEIAVRLAMGASRRRLMRQMLTESLLLALIAGFIGVLAASWTTSLVLNIAPSKIPRLQEVAIGGDVLAFALLVSVITGLLFGLIPALQVSRSALSTTLKEGGRGADRGAHQRRVRNVLVISEFALSLVLMIGAGLLLRTFLALLQVNPGFNAHNVLTASIWLPQPNDPTADPYAKVESRAAFVREVLRRTAALPGVEHAAMATSLPLTRSRNLNPITIEDHPSSAGESPVSEFVAVSAEYFSAMGTPLLRGRVFTEADQKGAPDVVLIDQAAARKFWPEQNPLGRRMKFGGPESRSPWATVVGVVGDIKHDGLDVDGVPHVYFSIYQRPSKVLGVVLRSRSDPAALGEAARREIQAVDPNLPVFAVRTLQSAIDTSVAQQRFSAQLVGAFAVIALLLAAIGIYGVIAYSVGQRTREIGVRMALGASPGDVLRHVLGQSLSLIATGVAAGLMAALGLSRLLTKLLYGVSANDPLIFIGVPLLLAAVALLASYLPARKATRIDPLAALRFE